MLEKRTILGVVKQQGIIQRKNPDKNLNELDWDNILREILQKIPPKFHHLISISDCLVWCKRRIRLYEEKFPSYKNYFGTAVDQLIRYYTNPGIIARKKVHPSQPKQVEPVDQCGNGKRPCRCKKHAVSHGIQKKKPHNTWKPKLPIRISNTRASKAVNISLKGGPPPPSTTTRDESRNQAQFELKLKYERLMLSLQSPFPNEHQFTLEACLVLSKMKEKSSTRLDVLEKTPPLLNMLLAHAGFYNDCALRSLVQQTYGEAFSKKDGNGYNFALFWDQYCWNNGFEEEDDEEQLHHKQKFQLLCECYPGRLSEVGKAASKANDNVYVKCCDGCCVKQPEKEDSAEMSKDFPFTRTLPMTQTCESSLALEKMGDRIELVAEILRNFSFDRNNARVMMENRTMLRFLLVAVQTNYRSFTQIAFDIISNVTKYSGGIGSDTLASSSKLSKEDKKYDLVISQLKSMIADLVTSTFLLSRDRFKIIRCSEAITGLAMSGDRKSRMAIVNQRLCQRLLQLLTLKEDVILVVNCLECLLSISDIGQVVCNELEGSLSTLMSYVAVVEAGRNNEVNIAIKSTRVTTLLILRNIVKHSLTARRSFKRYETRLVSLAMSEEDCSWVASEILYYIAERDNVGYYHFHT